MYIIKGYFDTLVVRPSLVPFATTMTYGHDYRWKKSNVEDEKIISYKCNCSIIARMIKGAKIVTNDN